MQQLPDICLLTIFVAFVTIKTLCTGMNQKMLRSDTTVRSVGGMRSRA